MRELNEEFQDCIGSNNPSPADTKVGMVLYFYLLLLVLLFVSEFKNLHVLMKWQEDGQAADGSINLRIPDENFDRNCDR